MSSGPCRYPDVRMNPWLSPESRIPDTWIVSSSRVSGGRDGAGRSWRMAEIMKPFRRQRDIRARWKNRLVAYQEWPVSPALRETANAENPGVCGNALRLPPDCWEAAEPVIRTL